MTNDNLLVKVGGMRSHVHRIVDAIGSEVVQERLGVGEFSIRSAKRQRKFPALWYAELSAMCAELGVECPLDAFYWKGDRGAST